MMYDHSSAVTTLLRVCRENVDSKYSVSGACIGGVCLTYLRLMEGTVL